MDCTITWKLYFDGNLWGNFAKLRQRRTEKFRVTAEVRLTQDL